MHNIPYGKQDINQDDINAVINALTSDFLTQGPKIAEFEKAFAEYIGCKYAVAVSNGTAALHLCTLALGVNETSNVITTPITFAASANCVLYCGGNVSFVDIDPESVIIDLNAVENLLRSHPKGTFTGIVPVDFAGYPVNMERLKSLADEFGLWIIEDACHAPGGFFIDSKGVKQNCGNCAYADMAIFSFHPVKHIACGEGGMITTNDEALYKKLLILRTHGITKDPSLLIKNEGGWYYEMQQLGYNYRLTDFQSALGLSQLKRADDGMVKRRAIAARYDAAFKGSNVTTFTPPVDKGHGYHLYLIKVTDRKGLYDALREKGIYTQVHYIPVHTLPYYQQLGTSKIGDYPLAEAYYAHCLSLPMFPTLTDEEQEFVITSILNYTN